MLGAWALNVNESPAPSPWPPLPPSMLNSPEINTQQL